MKCAKPDAETNAPADESQRKRWLENVRQMDRHVLRASLTRRSKSASPPVARLLMRMATVECARVLNAIALAMSAAVLDRDWLGCGVSTLQEFLGEFSDSTTARRPTWPPLRKIVVLYLAAALEFPLDAGDPADPEYRAMEAAATQFIAALSDL